MAASQTAAVQADTGRDSRAGSEGPGQGEHAELVVDVWGTATVVAARDDGAVQPAEVY